MNIEGFLFRAAVFVSLCSILDWYLHQLSDPLWLFQVQWCLCCLSCCLLQVFLHFLSPSVPSFPPLSWEKTLQLRSRELLSCWFPKYISIKYVNLSLTYWTIFDHVGINKCHITIFSLDILHFIFFLSFISCKEWRTYDFESISL